MTKSELLARAVAENKLWSLAQELALTGDEDSLAISNLCARIAEEAATESDRLSRLAVDLDARVTPDLLGQQNLVEVEASDRSDAQRFSNRILRDGYTSTSDLSGAAGEYFFRVRQEATFERSDPTTSVVKLRWTPSRRSIRLPKRLRPSAADRDLPALPTKLWPGYFAVQPLRKAQQRARRSHSDCPLFTPGPTPRSLIDPLLDFAAVTHKDRVVEISAGPPNSISLGAQQRGCQVETVDGSQLFRPENGRSGSVRRKVGRGRTATVDSASGLDSSVAEATVTFLFASPDRISEAVYRLRALGYEGSLISFDQQYVQGGVKPARSEVILGSDALTVAHSWP